MFKHLFRKLYFLIFNIKNSCNIASPFVSHRCKISKGVKIGYISAVDSMCSVGKYTSIGKNVNITKTIIGNYTSIGNNVSIGQGEHDLTRISTKAMFYGEDGYKILTSGVCSIGHDVWIGANATILRNVKIGNGSVIGAGAVVTKDVGDFEIVVGVPAKKLRDRFPKDIKLKISSTNWWLKDPEEVRNIFKGFTF